MFNIIVIEDDKIAQAMVKKVLREISALKDNEVKIKFFSKFSKELKDIIKDLSEKKIYIVDIELETKISGIEIAKYIRNIDWESEIIFITNHDKMFETTFRNVYSVFDFIEKFHDFEMKLKKDIKLIFNKKYDNKMLIYSSRNLNLRIFYRSITYIYRDKEERKIVINTDKSSFSFYLSLVDCLEYLDDRFKFSHRSCIVNTERVQVFNFKAGYFELDTGEKVELLSKKYKKELEDNGVLNI